MKLEEHDHEPVLYPHGITDVAWAKKYGLSLKPVKCPQCNIDLYPTIPFATKSWRGLRSKPHACGPAYDLKRLAAATEIDRKEMKKMYQDLAGDL